MAGQTTFVPLWDRMEGAWLWTLLKTKKSSLVWKMGKNTAKLLTMTVFFYPCSKQIIVPSC
jgi:hypothetical protein